MQAGVKDVREVVEAAQVRRRATGKGTLLFLDEVNAGLNSAEVEQAMALIRRIAEHCVREVAAREDDAFW